MWTIYGFDRMNKFNSLKVLISIYKFRKFQPAESLDWIEFRSSILLSLKLKTIRNHWRAQRENCSRTSDEWKCEWEKWRCEASHVATEKLIICRKEERSVKVKERTYNADGMSVIWDLRKAERKEKNWARPWKRKLCKWKIRKIELRRK